MTTEWTTIYEAEGNVGISLIEIIPITIALIVLIVGLIKWWKKTDKVLRIILEVVVFVICLGIEGEVSRTLQLSSQDFYSKYKNGECIVSEGYITEYEAERVDSFVLNNVEFAVADRQYDSYGYSIRQQNGGVLKNGEYVRIHYFEYEGMPVMMKLEIRD